MRCVSFGIIVVAARVSKTIVSVLNKPIVLEYCVAYQLAEAEGAGDGYQ